MASKVVNLTIRLKDGVSAGLGRITNKLGSVSTGFSKLGTGLKKVGGLMKSLATSAGLASIGFGALIADAAKFNVQTARVWTMAGGGVTTFKRLREGARALASEFGLARGEIATGMYNALSAGVSESNLQNFMKQAAKVAVADGSDISTAVDGITTVLNAFKIEASNTQSVTDDLFKTVAIGKTTFSELSKTLATVAPIAAASNIPLKQILAHVATLTSQGTPTAQAMTQIRASIIGLNKALGDGWSDTMSYQDALKAVWKQAGGSQNKVLEMVGSIEAVQAVLGGVGINAEMATEKVKQMASSAGSAEMAFQKVNQFRHWPRLIETGRATLSKFFEALNEKIAPTVDLITKKLKDLGESDVLQKWADKAKSALDAVVETIKIISRGGEGSARVLSSISEVIKAAFKTAAFSAVNLLIKHAPTIGLAIGRAASELLGLNITPRSIIKKQEQATKQERMAKHYEEQSAKFAGSDTLLNGENAERAYKQRQLESEREAAQLRKEVANYFKGKFEIEGTNTLEEAVKNLIKVWEEEAAKSKKIAEETAALGGEIQTEKAKEAGDALIEKAKKASEIISKSSDFDSTQPPPEPPPEPTGDQTDRGGFADIARRFIESGEVSKNRLQERIADVARYERLGRESGFEGLGEHAADMIAGGDSKNRVEKQIQALLDAQLTGKGVLSGYIKGEGIVNKNIENPIEKTNEHLSKIESILNNRLGAVKET